MATTIDRNAYQFFRANAGSCVGYNAVGAASLARAEAAAQRMGWQYRWEADELPYEMGDAETIMPSEVLGCVLTDERGEVLESLWGIGDPDRNYMRLVQAELASEALSSATMATQRHTHIIAEEASGRPFERVEESPIRAQTARCVIVQCGGRIIRNVYCRQPIAECRKPENRIGGEAYMHIALAEVD